MEFKQVGRKHQARSQLVRKLRVSFRLKRGFSYAGHRAFAVDPAPSIFAFIPLNCCLCPTIFFALSIPLEHFRFLKKLPLGVISAKYLLFRRFVSIKLHTVQPIIFYRLLLSPPSDLAALHGEMSKILRQIIGIIYLHAGR